MTAAERAMYAQAKPCENVTGDKWLDCFWSGRSIHAEFGANQVCPSCIAALALAQTKGLAE